MVTGERGQLWSLDVVLAAVVFTLALGLILSQGELQQYYGQQDRAAQRLQSMAIQGSNGVVSKVGQVSLPVNFPCITGPGTCAPVSSANDTDSEGGFSFTNIRCGPNQKFYLGHNTITGNDNTFVKMYAWSLDNDLSGMENCMTDEDSFFRPRQFGVQGEYGMDLNARMVDGNNLRFRSLSPGSTNAYFKIVRRMVVFPQHPRAWDLRMCNDGNCGQYITDVNVVVWRP